MALMSPSSTLLVNSNGKLIIVDQLIRSWLPCACSCMRQCPYLEPLQKQWIMLKLTHMGSN